MSMSNTRIALLIVYNHRYDKNIPKLEEIYGNRFSNIYHIVPFYDGTKKNVITVYDSSYYFENYLAQAYEHIKNEGYTHYYFIADDMIVNPSINEYNLFEFVGIKEDDSWINDIRDYKTHPHHVHSYLPIHVKGIEADKFLPSKEEVVAIFKKYGLSFFPGIRYSIVDVFYRIFHLHLNTLKKSVLYLLKYKKKPFYPGIWGYSDTLIIPSSAMPKFAQYCGAFAGLNIFVEHAIPMALLLSSKNIVTSKDIKLKCVTQLYGLGNDGKQLFEDKYQYSLDKLLSDFPQNWFFVHPIKLSKWKQKINKE